ncbi:LytR/AlgR family response regulator transcription factor [Pedobacter sp.]|uniref:LytR/AlgR family response regulator transcription factor n=1 Tax=Pedobacter sp. TaxID=1411316 RepID=UPI003BAB7A20
MKIEKLTNRKITCILIDDEPHALSELGEILQMIPMVDVMGSFSNARDALGFLQIAKPVDVIFSDIQMPMINGIEAGKHFRAYCKHLVYVTAYRDFALEAIRVKVTGYILKPVKYTEVLDMVNQIMTALDEESRKLQKEDYLVFKGEAKHHFFKVMTRDILYFEGMANYVIIHTPQGNKMTYKLLKDIEEEFSAKNIFVRISKRIVISLLHFDSIDGHMLYLDNRDHFPVGLPYQQKFYSMLSQQLG